jgi:hypothetical protein
VVKEAAEVRRRSPLAHFASDVWVLTKRSIARIRREPETLADVTLLHPELAVVCWSVAMLVVFAPLAVHLYRRKALG